MSLNLQARTPRRRRGRGVFLALLAAILTLTLAPRAEAYVYWNITSDEGAIGRANVDGTNATWRFIKGLDSLVLDIAVDSDHIYWTSPSGGAIGRANLDGTGVDQSFITGVTNPLGLAVDADHIYWTYDDFSSRGVGRANLDGSGLDENFVADLDGILDIAVDADHLYWVGGDAPHYDALWRAELDGTNVEPNFIDTGWSVQGVAVDAESIYWSMDIPLNRIDRANLDGTGVDQSFITGSERAAGPKGLALDASHLFWTNSVMGSIGRANLDGSQPSGDLIPDANRELVTAGYPYDFLGLAVDGLYTVDTTPPDTRLRAKCPPRYDAPCPSIDRTRRKFTSSASEPNSTFECKLDRRRWRGCRPKKEWEGLKQGKHKFSARAIDAAGNTDPTPAKDKFKVVG